MNYYYDIVLNFSKSNLMFYEWQLDDDFAYIEKTPIFRINEKQLKTIVMNDVIISNEFFENIKDKTFIKLKNSKKTITTCCIFTDSKSAIALQFNKDGRSFCRSYLLPEDDLNVLEMAYCLKKKNVSFCEVLPIKQEKELRIVKKIKSVIKRELNELYKNKNIVKMKYFFLEWFLYEENDLNIMYFKMMEELKHANNTSYYKIYKIIKMSSNNV